MSQSATPPRCNADGASVTFNFFKLEFIFFKLDFTIVAKLPLHHDSMHGVDFPGTAYAHRGRSWRRWRSSGAAVGERTAGRLDSQRMRGHKQHAQSRRNQSFNKKMRRISVTLTQARRGEKGA